LGYGGFHLIEAASKDAANLLNTYLDAGGNYIETAASYGDGISERKIGAAVSGRRKDFVLATKVMERDSESAAALIDRSLKNLKTDCVDILYMHAVQNFTELDEILEDNGAVAAALEARKAGKVKYIGITGHGRQHFLYQAIKRFPFDVLMTGFNYLDRFNYPENEVLVLTEALRHNIGIFGMKALADGYLYRSWQSAFRYALSLPVHCLVVGMANSDQLGKALETVKNFVPMTAEEKEELFLRAPELSDYVCRQCGKCREKNFDPSKIFALEGLFDRQMDSMRPGSPADFALQERLKSWFQQDELARDEYASLPYAVDPGADYSRLNSRCPYGIDLDRKLKIAHGKLDRSGYIY
ncbi:MAG: aldo/keto reductase, partial [Spirochaetales bacterium]